MADGLRLGVDFGTSNTVAVLSLPGAPARPLLFDGSELLPSAVCADPAGNLLVGRDAQHAAQAYPSGFEPNPKRCIDDGSVLLHRVDVPVQQLFAAVLVRVAEEARAVAGRPVEEVVLTCPAEWGSVRREVLVTAARAARLPEPALVWEPVAAASYLVEVAGAQVKVGSHVLIYDFGAGTFDASVLRRTATGFEVLATKGLPDAGGLDIDAAIVAHLGAVYSARDADTWARLARPASDEERRAARVLWDQARTGKEMLSRMAQTLVHVPFFAEQAMLTREQFDELSRPVLERTIRAVRAVLREAAILDAALETIFLVGGSSRIPMVATRLHQAFGIAPTVLERPELVVAEGCLALAITDTAGPPSWLDRTSSPVDESAQAPPSITAAADAADAAPADSPPPVAESPTGQPPPTDQPGDDTPTHDGRAGKRRVALLAGTLAALLIGIAGFVYLTGRPNRPNQGAHGPSASTSTRPSPTWQPRTAHQLADRPGRINAMAFSHDGTLLATADSARTVRLWNVVTQQSADQPLTGYGNDVNAVAISRDDHLLATGDQDGKIRLWNLVTHESAGQPIDDSDGPVWDLAFSPTDNVLASAAGLTVRLRDANTGQPIGKPLIVMKEQPRSVTFSPNGRLLATAGFDGKIRLWNPATGQPTIQPISCCDGIFELTFSPDGTILATADNDHTVRLWNPATGQQIGQPLTGHTERVWSVAFSPDGRVLASSSADSTIRLWDVATGRQLGAPLPGTNSWNFSLAFNSDGLLATATESSLSLWNVSDNAR